MLLKAGIIVFNLNKVGVLDVAESWYYSISTSQIK